MAQQRKKGQGTMNREQAQERIQHLKKYYGHLVSYLSVNGFLMAINLLTSPGYLWFLFPMLGWGIGLAVHTFKVFGTGHDWETRKLQELTGHSVTKDELQRLTERTDSLVTILSSINWDHIDPELVGIKENLERAQQNIARLQENGSEESGLTKKQVAREIEKLEEFVTSSRFRFIDQAQSRKN